MVISALGQGVIAPVEKMLRNSTFVTTLAGAAMLASVKEREIMVMTLCVKREAYCP